jgi:hypothetical protein
MDRFSLEGYFSGFGSPAGALFRLGMSKASSSHLLAEVEKLLFG